MRRVRRGLGLLERKSYDELSRGVRLRNMRINYSLNHEWERLNREIWVCAAKIASLINARPAMARLSAGPLVRFLAL